MALQHNVSLWGHLQFPAEQERAGGPSPPKGPSWEIPDCFGLAGEEEATSPLSLQSWCWVDLWSSAEPWGCATQVACATQKIWHWWQSSGGRHWGTPYPVVCFPPVVSTCRRKLGHIGPPSPQARHSSGMDSHGVFGWQQKTSAPSPFQPVGTHFQLCLGYKCWRKRPLERDATNFSGKRESLETVR